MLNLFEDFGCNINKYTDVDSLTRLIKKFNIFLSLDEDVKYISCKDDAGVFVLITDKYVIKIYKDKTYNKIIKLYHVLLKTKYDFKNIEKIYYYYSISKGLIIHDTHINIYFPDNKNKIKTHQSINATVIELLEPTFLFKYGEVTSKINWNKHNTKKLLLDVANGLIELHKNDIIHGDMNPDNVGYRKSDDNFVIFDFVDSSFGSTNEKMRDDVNRFLKSLTITYQKFFTEYLSKINRISNIINTNQYNIYKFRNAINDVFE